MLFLLIEVRALDFCEDFFDLAIVATLFLSDPCDNILLVKTRQLAEAVAVAVAGV